MPAIRARQSCDIRSDGPVQPSGVGMPVVHVLTNRHQTEQGRLADAVAIVVDVLFATSCIAIALKRAVAEIMPALDPEAARNFASTLAPGTFLLAGERDGLPVPGFLEPWPHRLIGEELKGKTLVYSTTNGTVALQMSSGAAAVYTAALVNGQAVAEHVYSNHEDRDVVIVCAGVGTSFALEDFYGAGYIASLLGERADYRLTDAARAARLVHDRADAAECLFETYTGRMLAASGLGEDLATCARKRTAEVVPLFRNGRIRAA
jgi:2-phosphosulfolactate phosphatase